MSEKLHLAVDWNKYKDPELNTMQRVKNLEGSALNAISIKSSPQGSKIFAEKEAESVKCVKVIVDGRHKRNNA